MSMLANLETIRQHGIRMFVKSEREHRTCGTCWGTIDVHHGRCSSCGKEQEYQTGLNNTAIRPGSK